MRTFNAIRWACALLVASDVPWPAAPPGMSLVAVASAQQTIGDASVSGRIADPTNAGLPGAIVTARHVETNVTTQATTDDAGRFRFPYLRVGAYELQVRLDGFRTAVRALELRAGSAFDVPVTLQLAGVSADVTVTAEAPVLDTARSQVAVSIERGAVEALPMNGRNFLDVALLAPTVAPPNINSTQVFAETSAVPGVGLSVNGQRNLSNSVVVDGLSANDDAAGLSGMPYGIDAVEEVQVVTSGGQAELGRALGGYVSVVTRSGTNQLHGTGYWFWRDDRFNAASPLTGTTLPMSQHQYGASLGGPVRRARTFYFANLERRDLDQSGLTTITPANVALINARLAAVGYPGQPVTTGLYDAPVDARTLLGRLDHAVSGADQLSVRYSFYDVAARNARGAGGLASPSASAGLDNRDQAISVANTLTLGARTVNETRAQYTWSDLEARSSDLVGPAVSIAGIASFGTLSSSPQARINRMLQVVSSLSHQRGGHALRGGVDLVRNADRIEFPRAFRGSYTFGSMNAFLAGTYNNAGFTQTFGATEVEQGSTHVGVYLQDAWQVSSALTLNLGLRYDLQTLDTIETDTDNVAPRVGLAWSPTVARTLVVRGSVGLYVDRVPLRALANALLSAGNTTDLAQVRQVNVSLSPGQAGAPTFPGILAAPTASVTLPNLTTMDRRLQNASSRQASVEVERQVGRRGAVSVGYLYLRGRDLLMAINQNVPSCVPSGTNNGCRPVAAYGNDSRYSSAGSSTSHALVLTAQQRTSSWGEWRASYTLARAENDLGEFFFSGPIDPFDVSKDWGRADSDRRHLLVLSGSVASSTAPAQNLWQVLTHGFRVSGLLQAYSAAPFNITSGVTTLQGTAGRPIVDGAYIPRNSGVGDEFVSLGLRVSRAFALRAGVRLEATAEVFNLTDAVNETARNTTFGTGAYPTTPSPTFNQVTATGDPRSAQFALRLRF